MATPQTNQETEAAKQVQEVAAGDLPLRHNICERKSALYLRGPRGAPPTQVILLQMVKLVQNMLYIPEDMV